MPEVIVLDASAMVEVLLGSQLGARVRGRLRGCELHVPAVLDAEILSALGRLHRAGDLSAGSTRCATSLAVFS